MKSRAHVLGLDITFEPSDSSREEWAIRCKRPAENDDRALCHTEIMVATALRVAASTNPGVADATNSGNVVSFDPSISRPTQTPFLKLTIGYPPKRDEKWSMDIIAQRIFAAVARFRLASGMVSSNPQDANSPKKEAIRITLPPKDLQSTQSDETLIAKPLPGKKGFVISPYDVERRVIDVRNLKSGQEAKCPYTGRVFRILLRE